MKNVATVVLMFAAISGCKSTENRTTAQVLAKDYLACRDYGYVRALYGNYTSNYYEFAQLVKDGVSRSICRVFAKGSTEVVTPVPFSGRIESIFDRLSAKSYYVFDPA
jgi:hypothetical protein